MSRSKRQLNLFYTLPIVLLLQFTLPALAHEDHGARHGGFVMMFLQMHFELVLPSEGGVQIYYSDPMRMELPASVVADVAVEIERPDRSIEPVMMQISDSGDSWQGGSTPVTNPESIVRVAFMFQGEPFILDIPAMVFPGVGEEDETEQDMEHMQHDESMQNMNHGCQEDCAD